MLKYDAHNYDDFLKLKISGSLWFSIFYGIRHFVLFVGIKLMADNFGLVDWVNVQVNYFFILAEVILFDVRSPISFHNGFQLLTSKIGDLNFSQQLEKNALNAFGEMQFVQSINRLISLFNFY